MLTIGRRWALGGVLVLAALTIALASSVGAVATAALRPHIDAVDVPGSPLDLTAVTFGQQGERMVLQVRTAGTWSPDQLSISAGRSVCVKLFYGNLRTPRARICVIAAGGGIGLRYTRLDPAGHPFRVRALSAAITRPDGRSFDATFTPAAAGLRIGRYAWQAETTWAGSPGCATPATCTDRVPDNGIVVARIAAPQVIDAVGCVADGPTQRSAGPRKSRDIALTFDDGPSRYTPAVLHELEQEHVPATFFLVGSEVAGHQALLHRMLRDGYMIANHTLTHANVAGGGAYAAHQIATTQTIIRRASGFEPCLFRPPYGATSGALTAVVRTFGALSILWDVDPRDWSTPGTSAIVSTVLHQTRPGSIILLHDGGGPRAQTIAALPTIIHTLRRRGLHFVTITQLLHLRLRERRSRRQPLPDPGLPISPPA